MSHHNIHMDYLLTADADINEQEFETSIRRLSVGSSETNASSHGPHTPSPSVTAPSTYTGETVSPSLLFSSEFQDLTTMEKSYSSSMLGYGHNPYMSAEYPVLSSIHHPEYMRASSTASSFSSGAIMSPLSVADTFYHSPAPSFGSDSTFDEGHDAATIAAARAAMPGLLHEEDVDEDHMISPSYLSMLSPKSKSYAAMRAGMREVQATNIICPQQPGVQKKKRTKPYPVLIPSQDSKPHKCLAKGCNARFKRQEHLKRHERTHTGEKPFYCDVSPDCGRYFSRSDNLRQHKKTHFHFNPRGRNKFVGSHTQGDISGIKLEH
ncbi:uncharacterized protein DFL_001688 [Arthrobotrys flagrans]|uniref:C2H2-type domain-containing protein n=1 Tax=Arthrobotrys flagrans TaxID=97331 RepID=A0A437A8B8_ARTFL|nr:hypothetical protein DFL_001688 [Arthrobotrys flagrans]